MPHRSRCNDWRPESRRRERSASITFDLEEERRAELRRRNSKKEKKKEEKTTRTRKGESPESTSRAPRRLESPERGTMTRSKSVGAILVKKQQEEEPAALSMWSCRRCTLENPLHEATCLACGGSRLCSIGDIEPPPLAPPHQPALNLLRGEEMMLEKGSMEQEETKEKQEELKSWHCVVCTLENEPLAYYCDACNTQSPLKSLKDLKDHNRATTGWTSAEFTKKAARYFAIFCFVAILATSMFNMAICFYNALVSMGGLMVPSTPTPPHLDPGPAQVYVANPIPVEVLADSAIS